MIMECLASFIDNAASLLDIAIVVKYCALCIWIASHAMFFIDVISPVVIVNIVDIITDDTENTLDKLLQS